MSQLAYLNHDSKATAIFMARAVLATKPEALQILSGLERGEIADDTIQPAALCEVRKSLLNFGYTLRMRMSAGKPWYAITELDGPAKHVPRNARRKKRTDERRTLPAAAFQVAAVQP